MQVAGEADRPGATVGQDEAQGAVVYTRPAFTVPPSTDVVTWLAGASTTRRVSGNLLGVTIIGERVAYVTDEGGALSFSDQRGAALPLGPRGATNRVNLLAGPSGEIALGFYDRDGMIIPATGSPITFSGLPLTWIRDCR